MPQPMPAPNPEDQRTDLEAMLAASRELGPDMDKALVDSYMGRHKTRTPASQGAGPQPGQSILPRGGNEMRYIGLGALAGGLILAALFSTIWTGGGHAFWFPWFFLPWLFFMVFRRRGMYRSRRTYTYTDENGQQVQVRERLRGYGYGPYRPYGGPNGPYPPFGTRGGTDSSERVDPDGQPRAPGTDASAASNIQSKYGAPESGAARPNPDAPSQYRPRYAAEDEDQSPD